MKEFTEKGIHYFTDREGRKWAHFAWEMITGEIPSQTVYPTTSPLERFECIFTHERYQSRTYTYPQTGPLPYALICADRIEVVTEHVPATVLDALQALVASAGKPVGGWLFRKALTTTPYDGESLTGCDPRMHASFLTRSENYAYAFRPVTRVRIKPEVKPLNTRDVPEGVNLLPEDKPWLAYIGIGDGRDGERGEWVYSNTGYTESSGWDNGHGGGYSPCLIDGWHYAIDVRHPEARKKFPEVCKAHDYSKVYGYTLDGNPVPPPPDGWEIVPEGEGIGKDAKFYHSSTSDWLRSEMQEPGKANVWYEVRAYARRVVKKPSFDEINEAFNTYWHGGSKHRAIDAFRAGVKWAKEVRGE